MMKDRTRLKLILMAALILLVISAAAGFNALGLRIYSDRFYVFSAISCFLVFVFIKMLFEHMKMLIDQKDKAFS